MTLGAAFHIFAIWPSNGTFPSMLQCLPSHAEVPGETSYAMGPGADWASGPGLKPPWGACGLGACVVFGPRLGAWEGGACRLGPGWAGNRPRQGVRLGPVGQG